MVVGKMEKALPFIGMAMAECAQAGLIILSKQAMSTGMSNLLFVFYSNSLAAIILLPFSFFFHRQSLPSLNFSLVCGFFLLGLIGCFAQIFGYAGINYSSPTLGTAMLNLIPAFTFILAIIFRLERLNWRSSSGLAKCAGTIVSIAGASIVTFYKGPPILMTRLSLNLSLEFLFLQQSHWVLGGLLLTIDCVLASSWLIVQAKILKKYPAELVVVFYYCFFVAIQSAAICLIFERDSSAWSLKPNTRLIAILYSAVFGSAFQLGVSTWCLHKTGPVFVSMFKPFGIVITVAAGVLFFKDTFYVGSLVGAIVIVVGFYSVMWGKAKEAVIRNSGGKNMDSASIKAPLLHNIIEEI